MPDNQVIGDTEGAVQWLRAQPWRNGKVGVIGSCSGGRQTFLLGAGATNILRAQSVKKPAYFVADVAVTDMPAFQAYAAKVPETLKPYNARVIVRARPDAKEGAAPQGNIVVLAFDSLADAEKWYSTPPYSELIPLRQKSATTQQLYIVEGLPQLFRHLRA
ncbi:MAG TPA: DUF1330 domain-containing protein [Acetobacteraceae bacterium]|nr:DUF1330 domain-containing protein [Acetobacteraceae bacterium]